MSLIYVQAYLSFIFHVEQRYINSYWAAYGAYLWIFGSFAILCLGEISWTPKDGKNWKKQIWYDKMI